MAVGGTPRVGRDAELETARAWMASERLVTLWGPAGIGKTYLARALCAEQTPRPAWVALAGVSGEAGLVAAVAAVLGGGPDPGPALAQLSERWLVLDTVEHLLDSAEGEAVTRRIAAWLEAAPRLRILATSQRRLRLGFERPLELGPLDADSEAIELFVQLVRQQRPDFVPDEAERALLARLVAALEGIPLVIELAAARWELLGTEGLLDRLGRPLAVLAQPRSADPRHGTLRQAIGWSWELLPALERRALGALATFRGPFDVDSAEALVGVEALERLESLRDAALVRVPEPGRFQLFDSTRAYALERTDPVDREHFAEVHATWCVDRAPDPDAGRSEPGLRDDLEAAARYLLRRADPRAERAIVALGAAAPGQHLPLLDAAVDALPSPGTFRTRGRALRQRGQREGAEADFRRALELARSERERGHLLRELGVLFHAARDEDAARDHYERALACHKGVQDRRSVAVAIGNLGALDHDLCRYEDAELRYGQALTGLRAVGDRRVEAIFLQNQAVLRQEQGQLVASERAYRRALEQLAVEHDARMQAITLGNLGFLLHELGRLDEAHDTYVEALEVFVDVPDPGSEALCRARLGAVRAMRGDVEGAHRDLDVATRVVAQANDPLFSRVIALFGAFVAAAQGDRDTVRRALDESERAHDGEAALVEVSADARVAARLLRAAAQEPEQAVRVRDDGFQVPGGEWQDLSRYATSRRMFWALVQAAHAGAGHLSIEDLFEAGWSGEQIGYDSMRNRVHVNLARLRRMGLKRLLLREPEGYRLDPSIPVVEDAGPS